MRWTKIALLGFLFLALSALLVSAAKDGATKEEKELVKEFAASESESAEKDGFSEEQQTQIKAKEETFEFQAEVNRLMDIIINSLYSNREIFVRELISNAADALDKLRFRSLTDKAQLGEGALADLDIRISYNKEKKTLTFQDKGIGMTKEELIKNLGVVAKSGTTEFVEAAAGGGGSDSLSLIGQFGVGFYSVYLVADRVTVVSKSNDSPIQHVWDSTANSVFTVSEDPRGNTLGRGTSITLHLKEDAEEFLNEAELEKIVGRYSEFINFPIYLRKVKEEEKEVPIEETDEDKKEEAEKAADKEDDDLEVSEEEESEAAADKPKTKKVKTTTYTWKLLNEAKAIWTRNPKDITEEEYESFFKALTKGTEGPLDHIHFVAEGEITFRSILFIPKVADPGMYDKFYEKSTALKLYVRRVLIADEFDDFLPRYLNFIKGVVDSEDLPLNVSRETLAQSRVLKVMSKKLTRKVLEMLRKMSERGEGGEGGDDDDEDDEDGDKKEKTEKKEKDEKKDDKEVDSEKEEKDASKAADEYNTFWKAFGKSIKLGIMDDRKNKSKLVKLLRFASSAAPVTELTSLEAYVDRMKEDQKYIYYITGESLDVVQKSPMLERLKKKGLEVLYMVDALDEYVVQMVTEFDGHTLQSVAKTGLKTGEDDEKQLKQVKEKWKSTLSVIKDALGDKVSDVEVSNRLEGTPCVVVTGQYGWGANMRRIMTAQTLNTANTDASMYGKKTLEINYRHPIIRAIKAKVEAGEDKESLSDGIQLLFDAALTQSGFTVEDPAAFSERVSKVVGAGLSVPADAQIAPEDVDLDDEPAEKKDDEKEEKEEVEEAKDEEAPKEEL